MKTISIFNHVLGPVMRGPSSSHTAGAFHLGSMARSLLGGTPRRAVLAFDPAGSYAATYAAQGADRGFAMGLLGQPLTDESFFTALSDARPAGMDIAFEVRQLASPDHPNTVEWTSRRPTGASARGRRSHRRRRGGNHAAWTVARCCSTAPPMKRWSKCPRPAAAAARACWPAMAALLDQAGTSLDRGMVRLVARRKAALPADASPRTAGPRSSARGSGSPRRCISCRPARRCSPARRRWCSWPRIAAGRWAEPRWRTRPNCSALSEAEVLAEMLRRYDIMVQSVERGLDPDFTGLQLLPACAGAIFQAEAAGPAVRAQPAHPGGGPGAWR